MRRKSYIKSKVLKALGLVALTLCLSLGSTRQVYAQWDVYDVIPVPGDIISSIWAQLSGCPPVPGLANAGVCLTPPIPGTLDADLVFGLGQITSGLAALNEGMARVGQISADSGKIYHMQAQAAEDTGNAFISDHSLACALTMSHQARDVMNSFVNGFTAKVTGMMTARGTGPQADETSLAAATERVCEVADFICTNTNRLGPNLSNAFSGCPNGSGGACQYNMGDADVLSTSLTEKYQLTLPANVNVTKTDQHIQINATTEDEYAFKAAWKLCEHMLELLPPSPHGTVLNAAMIEAVDKDRYLSAMKMGGVRSCAYALAYRTACPASAPSIPLGVSIPNLDPQGGAVTDCHSAQVAACHRLKTQPPNGIGIVDAGNNSNYALQNCDQNGLSAAMYDYIYSHRCMNGMYVSTTMPQIYGGHTARVEEELQKCLGEGPAFDTKWKGDNADLVRLLSSVADRYGSGGNSIQNINNQPNQ